MAKTSSIPDSILQYRPCKCTRIRADKGIYRVYKYQAEKRDDGTWSNNWGYLIGKIIPNVGFIPNKRYQKELKEQGKVYFEDETTDLCYGNYALLMFLSKDILVRLKDCFEAERAVQIYSYALILCANGFVYLDQLDEYYKESILSLLYNDYSFKMGYTAIHGLLHELGMKGNPIKKFEQSLFDNSSGHIAIDGHVIRSCSNENDLADVGYKAQTLKAPQINVLIAYDPKNNIPLLYRTYRGSTIDKKACEELLLYYDFKNINFVIDRGFFSPSILKIMSENGNSYIVPLPASDKNFKRIKENIEYSSGEFIYKINQKETARIVYYEENIDQNTRIIFYKDMDENNSKRKSYQQHIAASDPTYTQENYELYCKWWGVYALQTTRNDQANIIYADYKDRWSIETYNNYVKNDAIFQNLKIQDYYVMHGFDFIMLVTGLIHSRLNEAVKNLKRPNISTVDILIKAGHMRMVKYDKLWKLHNTRTKDIELLEEMGFIPDKEIKPNT